MLTQASLSLALLVAIPAWSQVPIVDGPAGLSTTEGLGTTDQMLTPAPVSDQAYPTAVGAEQRSNYLRGGLSLNTAYTDNALGDLGVNPVKDVEYSIYPTIAFDKVTSRIHWLLTYSPGFTFYQRTSSRNQTDQNVALNFQYRLSPHVTVTLQDTLLKTSNIFNQADALSGGAISGSAPPLITFVGPVADVLGNAANAELTYQFRRNGMVGAEGIFAIRNYLKPAEVPGLYDSSSSGGSAFYSHRLSKHHYIGTTYQYSRILAYPVNALSSVETNSFVLFYTIYLKPNLSVSLSGGPQHFDISQAPLPSYGSWSPTITASMGWQGRHTSLAGSYSRLVTGGGGLLGAFKSNNASVSARWEMARTWSVGAVASYFINKNVTPTSFLSTGGGHSLFGTFSAQHSLSEHLQLEFGYTRLQQSYSDIEVISRNPNTNREFINVSYQFKRPLGG